MPVSRLQSRSGTTTMPTPPCIWFLSKYVVAPRPGDPASRGFGLMREFARRGYRAVIVTSDAVGTLNAPRAQKSVVVDNRDGVTVCTLRTFQYTTARSVRRVLSWLDFERKLLLLRTSRFPRPDVIIVSSLSLLTILNGARLRRRYGCRLVFDIRDIWPLVLVDEGGMSPRHPLVRLLEWIERWGYRHADLVGGTMPNLAAHVRAVTGIDRPTYCIPHGLDIETIETPTPLDATFAATYIPTDRFIIGYAGSLGTGNAMEVLFDCAVSMHADTTIHFLVVGDGDLRTEYLSRYGSLPNVTIAPAIPKAQVHDLLTRCDVLYFSIRDVPMYIYGRSLNKTTDYMLAARPIIASYSGYPMGISEAGCGIFVPAGDVDALRTEIRRFAAMTPAERTEMGERGRTWLLAHRTYPVLADEFLRVLFPETSPSG